jgi:DNA end-binding protein Ku
MAPRPYWKGYLKLSLVNCPVAMTPAVSDREKVKFHTLNRKTNNRVQSHYVDAKTGKEVTDEVKGYEIGEGKYVMLEDEELEAVGLESTRTIDIETFVDAGSVGWLWYDTPHYLFPTDDVGVEAFSVIREAMKATNTVGISRLVLYRRERAVLLEPRDKGIVLWTLRYGNEVRDPDDYFSDIPKEKVEPKLMSLVNELIEQRSRPWEPAMAKDPVQKELLGIIKSRGKKKKPKEKKEAEPPAERPSNVVDIMDALKRSVAAKEGRRKKG